MTDNASFLLFAPPRPPVAIDPQRDVVIGRSPHCDLPLESPGASRCHAAVRTVGDRRLVRDLGSTNGTFVNGERLVGERELEEGDRIEVGDVSVTYCRVEGAMAAAARPTPSDETVVMRRDVGTSNAALRGNLKQFPTFAVLQVLELGAQTGCLTVQCGSAEGRMWFEHGAPVHAEMHGEQGFDAAISITRVETGEFRFEPDATTEERTVRASTTHVLMEASRLADEEAL
jgi:pSer/pThr/pTyr-binding forkhead associated (FHA) protein